MSTLYEAVNKTTNTECILKVISKEKLKSLDYDFFLERLKPNPLFFRHMK